MAVAVDPGVGEVDVGQRPVLPIGDVQAQIPGAAEQVGVLQLHLTEHTLALAVPETAGDLSGGLFDNAEHDDDFSGLLRDWTQRHLDVTEQLGAVETFDVLFQQVAVEVRETWGTENWGRIWRLD